MYSWVGVFSTQMPGRLTESSVCVASIMRLLAVVNEDLEVDPTWNLVDQGIWAKMEADFAIISGILAISVFFIGGFSLYPPSF
jgi:hypothetical protein